MDTNKLVGILLLLTGVMDLVWARTLAGRLTPAARTALSIFGVIFLLLGGAMTFGFIRAA